MKTYLKPLVYIILPIIGILYLILLYKDEKDWSFILSPLVTVGIFVFSDNIF
jgi:hypothetical protein